MQTIKITLFTIKHYYRQEDQYQPHDTDLHVGTICCCPSEVVRFGVIVLKQRQTLTLSLDLGLADGNGEVFGLRLLRHLEGNAVHQLVLQEHHCNTNTHSENSDSFLRLDNLV